MANNKNKKKGGPTRKIKGRGDYEVSTKRAVSAPTGILAKLDKVLARIPKGSFAAGGAAIGARYGGAVGAGLGRRMGGGLAAVTGYGDYNVGVNSLSKMSASVDMVPQFVKNDHSVRVSHREFIRDLQVPVNPTGFVNTEQLINPANGALFPWLSRLAKQYSQYKIHGMVFVYKSMTSDYAASGPLGTVVFATNYNAIDRAFTSKIEMENSEFGVSCKPSMSLVHAIECDRSVSGETVLYVRDPAYETTDTSDKRFYDYGKFQVATAGLPGTSTQGSTLGELWVTYDIEFMKPVIGGDSSVGPAPALIGQLDGSVVVAPSLNPTGKIPRVYIRGAAQLAPAASTAYSMLPPASGALTGGDTGLYGPVCELYGSGVTTKLRLKKNGRYTVAFHLRANTVVTTAYTVGSLVTPVQASTATPNGTAAVSVDLEATGQVAHACLNATQTDGYTYYDVFEYYVTGIADGTGAVNYVDILPPVFTTYTAVLVAGLSRDVHVQWASIGLNSQTSAYVSPAP